MERPSLQRLLWQASLIRLRAGRLDGIGRSEGEWAHIGMEATVWKAHMSLKGEKSSTVVLSVER